MEAFNHGWSPRRDVLRFGRRAEAWYRAKLHYLVNATAEIPIEAREALVEWYLKWYQPDESTRVGFRVPYYVRWVPTDAYRGREFSAGGWEFCEDRFLDDIPNGLRAVALQLDELAGAAIATEYTSLDGWLKAEIGGTLIGRGARSGLDRVGCIVPSDQRSRLLWAAHKRQYMWPRRCRDCDMQFSPPDKRPSVRCPDCLAKRRRARKS